MDLIGASFNWQVFWVMAAKITAAYVLALPIGWERERIQHSVGLRTFPLVAMASCGYVLMADSDPASRSHIIQGLTTGIGFIGGGAIMRGKGNVHGTATAASIWNTGVIGAAVAESRFEMAVILSLLNLVTLHLLVPMKERGIRAARKAAE